MTKILFLGDLNLQRSFQLPEEITRFIESHDYVVANLEGPVIHNPSLSTSKPIGSLLHNSPEALTYLLSQIKITHVSIFNNHIGDYGLSGIYQTLEFCRYNNIRVLHAESFIHDARIIVCGLLEHSQQYYSTILSQYGYSLFDLPPITPTHSGSCFVYAHYGIEGTTKLSNFELNSFLRILTPPDVELIRHHTHVASDPLLINNNYAWPSLGDFLFINNFREYSEGLALSIGLSPQTIVSRESYRIACDGKSLKHCRHNYSIYRPLSDFKIDHSTA